MARIDFAIGPDSEIEIEDNPVNDPAPLFRGKRHAWLKVTDGERSTLTLLIGHYGCPTDAEIITSADLLIAAATTLRDSAEARIEAVFVGEGPFGDPAITGENGHPVYGEAAGA